MRSVVLSTVVGVLAFVLLVGAKADAQLADRVARTWTYPSSTAIVRALVSRRAQARPPAVDPSVVRFTPARDSGVAKALADAFEGSAQEKAALAELFSQVKQAYEGEVAKEGKSNNLAAALAFFVAANATAYWQSAEPSDKATEVLFGELRGAIGSIPELARLPNLEKQKMHDWLVFMGGFTLVGYTGARQTGDAADLETYRGLADASTRLVLGIEASRLRFKGEALVIEADPPASASSGETRIVGVWSRSASSPWGLSPGAVMTNVGYYKCQYRFRPDGTYTFKGESWGGYARSEEFWTIEESGSYEVSGNTLIISPSKSTATLRNRAGTVQRSQNNRLEKVTYRWQLHHFEGINETQLVLQPPGETTRDGGFASNSSFPNSYLYSLKLVLEWRF